MNDNFLTSWDIFGQTLTSGLQDWGNLHPVVVHIPLGLLFIVPIFFLGGLIFQRARQALNRCSLFLVILGVLGIYLAAWTGERASEHIQPGSPAVATLQTHDELAGQTKIYFTILAVLFGLFLWLQSKKPGWFTPKIQRALIGAYFLAYLYSLVLLLNAAHHGGKLVHFHGIKSQLYTSTNQTDKN